MSESMKVRSYVLSFSDGLGLSGSYCLVQRGQRTHRMVKRMILFAFMKIFKNSCVNIKKFWTYSKIVTGFT